jgi:hypothetical protein
VKHTHPKRSWVEIGNDYGDIVEISKLTTKEKPIETVYQKNKQINPEKISYGYIGLIEYFSYKNHVDDLLYSLNGVCYRVPIQIWRQFFTVGMRIRNRDKRKWQKKAK